MIDIGDYEMAILKKGVKGGDVKEAQKLLNKNGAKLKVDGDFGAKTEAATKAFQKKVKLKVDGQIGPITTAALKYGKPLPTMQTQDYIKYMAKIKGNWVDNSQIVTFVRNAQKALDEAAAKATKDVEAALGFYNGNVTYWTEVRKIGDQVIVKQKQFEKLRTKDPAAAEKLAKECADLDAKLIDIANKKIKPNRLKTTAALQRADKAMDAAVAAITKCRKEVEAEKATW
ncbi:MAG: peptidoglycan-binding domain-containing protein [Pseudomonadota bacterium]